mgnify:FL=1
MLSLFHALNICISKTIALSFIYHYNTTMSKPGQDHVRYEVIVQEDPNSDDLILPIPPQLLQQLGWKEGDDIDFSLTEDGKWIMRKV